MVVRHPCCRQGPRSVITNWSIALAWYLMISMPNCRIGYDFNDSSDFDDTVSQTALTILAQAFGPGTLSFNDLMRRLGHSSRGRHHYELVMEGIPEHTKTWQSICVRKAINDNETHNHIHFFLMSLQISTSVGDCSREMVCFPHEVYLCCHHCFIM